MILKAKTQCYYKGIQKFQWESKYLDRGGPFLGGTKFFMTTHSTNDLTDTNTHKVGDVWMVGTDLQMSM